ncbi:MULTISPECIES: DUF6124 family protein [Pseudomonas fluorescens group]|uniref:DUF3077 domain-containing protein n=3 Tax=Pseudomonas fluorescens group TaxID=136843 RepID=A0A3M4AM77_PSEMA|nr:MULTISPECIES: DUF6124 family protein [Pseudomonas fluorescens group]MCD7041157.1 DUF6124 family protein [Pseudomonas petroselini]MCD7043247.1 DUF6124 family protein [Pseudomonas petroselini]MCD7068973.1 DUF6124 family protein [Pseudomonas petroselini]MCD7077793.1 DUF6124 family protein [Pseudomonas petroselini]OAJ48512.1 hypothetical protein AO064_12640 [Pseudomonas marginalis]
MIKDSPNPPSDPQPTDQLFTVRLSLDSETLLANAAQDIASVQALTAHLAFEVGGVQRDVVLGIHRMLEGIQLMVDRVLDLNEVPELKSSGAS